MSTTTARKAISKSLRFEVFKRDSFACQYCGQKAPDVVLNVDHIHPVASGGDNSIVNLITACKACNSGKGKRKLSDKQKTQKQYEAATDAGERADQLRMIAKARRDLLKAQQESRQVAIEFWEEITGRPSWPKEQDKIYSCVRIYGLENTMAGLEYSFQRNKTPYDAIHWLIPSIKFKMKPEHEREAARINGILRHKFGCYTGGQFLEELTMLAKEDGSQSIISIIDASANWEEFNQNFFELFHKSTKPKRFKKSGTQGQSVVGA